MGFLDKVADLLDDGKLNGSADRSLFIEGKKKEDDTLAMAKVAASEKTADTLGLNSEVTVNFSSEEPIPYSCGGRTFSVKVTGTVCAVPEKEGLTRQYVQESVRCTVPKLIGQYIAKLGEKNVSAEQLGVYRSEIEEYVTENFGSDEMSLEVLMINSITAS